MALSGVGAPPFSGGSLAETNSSAGTDQSRFALESRGSEPGSGHRHSWLEYSAVAGIVRFEEATFLPGISVLVLFTSRVGSKGRRC
jgi:hypothetical protein